MTWIKRELTDLSARSLRRELRCIDKIDKARLIISGKTYVNFSSNNYLGLATHPKVIEAVREAAVIWGAGATASRLISGSTAIHSRLERALAGFLKKEAALLFPSGYMANLSVVTSLAGQGDAVIADRLNHASLIDAVRLSGARLFVYEHSDPVSAEKALIRARSYRRRLLMTDGLFSMDGDFAPLKELSSLCRRYDAVGMVDDAHALGIWGDEGRGVASLLDTEWLLVGTLSKALGSQGGFVCASSPVIDLLVNRARPFIFSTGLSPLCVAAALQALSLIQEDAGPRERVKELSMILRNGLKKRGWNMLGSESQIIPVLIGETGKTLETAERLMQAGIYAPAIRPPTVHSGECRIRFSVTADHTEADVYRLMEVLDKPLPPLRGKGGMGGNPPPPSSPSRREEVR
jgi:8-amino-7-oxononanoate synthase